MRTKATELIDFKKVNILLEGFNNATGFVTAILDLDGNVLSKSGWRQICTEFHRVHPETAKKCKISDTELAGKLAAGEKYHSYKCLNGLVDVAVPIIIDGVHVANLFSGQFFFEKPDKDFFIKQAEKYKFDTKTYLDALDKVPVISEEKVKTTMDFLLNMISEMSQQRIEQIESNKTLKDSEERWKFAIEENGDGLFDWNVETNEVFYSKQWKAMLGFEDDEIENKFDEWNKRLHPDDKTNAYLNVQNHLDGKIENYKYEHRLLCKDGSYKWILAKGKVISRNENNKPLRLLGTHRDITESKQSENKLRLLSQVIDHSLNAFDIVNHKGEFIYVNQTYVDMWGYNSISEVIETSPVSHCTDPNLPNHIINELKTHGKYISEFKARRKDGSIFDVLMHARLDHDEDGNEIYPTTSLDITDRKQAEEDLKKQKEMFELVINSVPTRIFWKDLNSVYLGCNQAFAEAVGYEKREAVIGKNDSDLIWAEEAQEYIDDDKQVMSSGVSKIAYDEDYTTPDGDKVWWSSSKMPLIDNNGKIFGVLATSEDVTERKRGDQMFKNFFEQPMSLNLIATFEGIIVHTNSAWLTILGYTPEELKGTSFFGFVHPDDIEITNSDMEKIKKGKTTLDFKNRYRHKNGSYRTLAWTSIPSIEDQQGYAVAIDVTEQDQAKLLIQEKTEEIETQNKEYQKINNELLEKEELLRKIAENYPNSYVSIIEKDFTIGFTSGQEFIKQKMNPEEFIGLSLEQVFGDNSPIIRDHYEKTFMGEERSFELFIDEQYQYYRTVPLYLEDGTIQRILTVVENITARKQVELKLAQLTNTLEAAQNMAKVGYWRYNIKSQMPTWSDQMFKVCGYKKENGVPNYLEQKETWHPDDWDMFDAAVQKCQTGTSYNIVVRIWFPEDKTYHYVNTQGFPVYDEDNDIKELFGTSQDITELKMAEIEIKKHRDNLEKLVTERTKELEEKYAELERINKLFVGRELRMVELKQKIKKLENK